MTEQTAIEESVDLTMDGAPAPSTLEPLCTRERLVRPPDWRYQAARQYLKDEREERSPVVPDDAVVQYAIRALRANSRGAANRLFLFNLWPVMEEVMYYGITARKSALAAELDTCLIKGWTHEEALIAGCPVRKDVYDLYAKLFFDLSGVRALHSWVHDFLFEPERYGSNTNLMRAHILAYYGTGGAGRTMAVSGMLRDDENSLMKSLAKSERMKSLFDYVMRHTSVDPETYMNIMEAASKTMSDREFQERMRDRDDAGSGSLEELAEGMEEGIRAYSQHELANPDKSGLDFVNQFTQTIIGTTDDGKKDI